MEKCHFFCEKSNYENPHGIYLSTEYREKSSRIIHLLIFPDVDHCFQNNPCSENGTCQTSPGASEAQCICDPGFAGDLCQCECINWTQVFYVLTLELNVHLLLFALTCQISSIVVTFGKNKFDSTNLTENQQWQLCLFLENWIQFVVSCCMFLSN